MTSTDVAGGIAQQMRESGQSRTWRKVTTILSAYDAYRLTAGVRERIAREFAAAGLELSPTMSDVSRDASVRISRVGAKSPSASAADSSRGLPAPVSIWAPSGAGWSRSASLHGVDLAIIDIDLSLGDDRDGLVAALPRCLQGLDEDVVKDLLSPDRHASFKMSGPTEATSRASLFVAQADDGVTASPDKAVLLSMSLVEFAVGDRWLLIARHPPNTYLSGSPADSGQRPPTADRYIESLMEYGLQAATTAEAAALAVINHGVGSFGRVRSELGSYLETWRTDFAKGSREKSLLTDLQATLPLVVDALEPLRRPSVVRWMEGRLRSKAKELSDQIERNYEALQDLQGTVSAAVGQADQAKNEDYQRSLATLAAVLLAPALIASIFGANDMLEDSPLDLIWLLFAMLIAGGLTQLFIRRRFGPRKRSVLRPRSGTSSQVGGSDGRHPQQSAPRSALPRRPDVAVPQHAAT